MSDAIRRTTGFADVNGARLYYEIAGEGDPLVLLHAGIADSDMWEDQLGPFAACHRVIRYDARGYGRSALPPEPFSQRDDLLGLLRHLGVVRTHLLGASYGGTVALDVALDHPELVRSLILVGSSASGHQPAEDVRRYWDAEDAALQRGDLDAATELTLRTWLDGPNRTPDQVAPTVRERVRAMQLRAYQLYVAGGDERPPVSPAEPRLAEVRVPTLIVVGAEDLPDKLAVADRLAGEIPGARKVVIPGGAHLVNMEQPAEFNRVVLEFLSAA
jgi:3-oxoadipate enol-lactonase